MGVATKDGPPLVLDCLLTRQLIAMNDFWEAAPPGLLEDLKPMAVEAADTALKIAMGQKCAGCTSLRAALTPVHNALWGRVARAREHGIDLGGVVDFVSAKRGYRPRPLTVYYKDDAGFQHQLTL